MISLVELFEESKAIEEAREEIRYRKQLRYEERDSRRMKRSSAPSTPLVPETEGYDKDRAKGRVLA
jgi:hypothetical protein